jgi:hypothetical protein
MKKTFININGTLDISEKTTFDMFKKSSLYKGQTDNRFFWLVDICEIEGLPEKFKIGLCFRNNLITRVELYCVNETMENETERDKKNQFILDWLKENYALKCSNIENSFDKRNNYSSIIISF